MHDLNQLSFNVSSLPQCTAYMLIATNSNKSKSVFFGTKGLKILFITNTCAAPGQHSEAMVACVNYRSWDICVHICT